MLITRLRLSLFLFLLLATSTSGLYAQSNESGITARLKDKELYLRGLWGDSELHFHGDGTIAVPSGPASFTVAGFKFDSAKLQKSKLTLRGERLGLEFRKNDRDWVEVDSLNIEIAKPANGDYGPALDAIFSDDFQALVPSLPAYWQWFARCKLFPSTNATDASIVCKPETSSERSDSPVNIGPHVPVETSRFALYARHGGASTVAITVDAEGKPAGMRVVSPAGLGLDEEVVAAAQSWPYTPAMRNGTPVKSEVEIQVVFQVDTRVRVR